MVTFTKSCNMAKAASMARKLGMNLKAGVVRGKFTVYME